MLTRLFEKRKLNVLLGCALITLSTHLWGQTFQNPIRAGAADPAMVYYNGFYYLTYSNGPRVDIVKSATIACLYYLWSSGSSNEISIGSMSNPWTLNGAKVIISTPTYDCEKVGAWVNDNPAAVKRNGKTYVTYSASTCFSPDYCTGMLVNTDG